MYLLKYEGFLAFFKPFNAVRDDKTSSLTFLPTSVINGVEKNAGIPFGSIKRNNLKFLTAGYCNQIQSTNGNLLVNGKIVPMLKKGMSVSIHNRFCLVYPVIIFGLDDYEIATALKDNGSIYGGQTDFIMPLTRWDNGLTDINGNKLIFEQTSDDCDIVKINDGDFDLIPGTETFPVGRDDGGIPCGINRQRNYEKQYVRVTLR